VHFAEIPVPSQGSKRIELKFIYDRAVRFSVRIGILHKCGKHLHDSIISLRRDDWDHKTSLTRHSLLKSACTKPRKTAVVYLCAKTSIVPLSTVKYDFGIVPTVW